MGIFGKQKFEVVENGTKLILPVMVYAPFLNKTTIKINKKQMNSSADTFF